MIRYFITSTGTEIGKTFVTAAMIDAARRRGRSVSAVKPLLSGFAPADARDSDAGVLIDALGSEPTPAMLDQVSPFRFAAPLSPDMAAAREHRALDFDAIVGFSRAALAGPEEIVLVEGVGGVMVPITPPLTVVDWIAALEIQALLVAGTYLGTISHTLTAIEALRARRVPIRALVLSRSEVEPVEAEETAATIARYAGGIEVVIVPRRAGPRPWRAVAAIEQLLATPG